MRQRLSSAQLAGFLNGVPDELRGAILALRELILRVAPTTDEAIKFHSLCYFASGHAYGVIGGNICMITPKRGCAHLGFIHGTALPDPDRLLQGSAKAKRFVVIHASNDIQRRPLRALIRAALDRTLEDD